MCHRIKTIKERGGGEERRRGGEEERRRQEWYVRVRFRGLEGLREERRGEDEEKREEERRRGEVSTERGRCRRCESAVQIWTMFSAAGHTHSFHHGETMEETSLHFAQPLSPTLFALWPSLPHSLTSLTLLPSLSFTHTLNSYYRPVILWQAL